jgi:hypothetical protein
MVAAGYRKPQASRITGFVVLHLAGRYSRPREMSDSPVDDTACRDIRDTTERLAATNLA